MRAGDRVNTPRGPGEVVFVRMAPPDFSKIAAVSMRLDSRNLDRGYTGTMFSVDLVSPETGAPTPQAPAASPPPKS